MTQPHVDLESAIHYEFSDKQLILEALTHTSFANEQRVGHNERLEFLGDSVLNAATTFLLFQEFPNKSEGQLSRLRARLVNTESLADIARSLQLGSFLRLGIGENNSGGREKSSILADATEALLGAVFLDAGYQRAADLVQVWMKPRIVSLAEDTKAERDSWRDPRSQLQERIQAKLKQTPTFEIIGTDGPPHAPVFTVQVRVGDQVLGQGKGTSKRDAIQDAARNALEQSPIFEA